MENKKIRVLVIAGSSRRETNCPGADSKAKFLGERVKQLLPKDWIVDFFNIGNDYLLPKIQSCNACVSTSMALCVWPCNCYKRHSFSEPDLMWDEDLYGRIYAADAILIISPINWYGPTSSIKLMFDRLVCANGGNPDEDLINHKDAKLAANLENSDKWKELSLNHLEGRTAAFFVYGDHGGDEIGKDGRPAILKHKDYLNPNKESKIASAESAYTPIIFQCRYSGMEVPDHLVKSTFFGHGIKYNKNQIGQLKQNKKIISMFDKWVSDVKKFVSKKGKAPTGKYPVALEKPDSQMNTFFRQIQLLFRKTLGSLWMHSLGYFTSRMKARQYRLNK